MCICLSVCLCLCVCLHVCVCLDIGLCCVAQAYYPASVSDFYDGWTDKRTHTHIHCMPQIYMVDFSYYGVYIWRIS